MDERHADAVTIGKTVCAGKVGGYSFLLAEPLSFWGGYDVSRGVVIDQHHPDCGALLAGRIVLMKRAKGSSSSSSVLAEAVRRGTAPLALVMGEPDFITAVAAMVAEDLYGRQLPIAIVEPLLWRTLARHTGLLTLDADSNGTCTFSLDWQ